MHDDTNQPPPPWPPRLLQLSRQASLVGLLDVNQQKPLLPRSMIAGKYLVDIVWFCCKVDTAGEFTYAGLGFIRAVNGDRRVWARGSPISQ
jgi:hypothetical protein